MKRINISLSEKSVNEAIKQLNNYKKELSKKATVFVKRLVEAGVDIAKQEILTLGAFDSGELADSIDGMMYVDGNKGVIFTNCGHAAFVEFGTGVVGSENPHPTLPWKYDINEHGEAGWVYFDEKQNRFRWTKGMPSRPYMYNTVMALEKEALRIAKEVWKS